LLELGRGFAFVARQLRISTESKDFYIDMVFYNYLLKCFVLFELLCGRPHKSSSVALPIMWRSAKQAAIFAPFQVFERHIIGARRRRRMPIRLFG
jgi:YhcG PDDEXK nuclease domain